MEIKPTSWYIWELYYLVRIPKIDTISTFELKTYGMYTTGNKELDKSIANEWITTYFTIAKMVEHYKEGTGLAIVKYSDIKEIYEHIENHLNAWKKQLSSGLNIGNAPIDDLVAMDEFANSVYEHAKYNFRREEVNDIMKRTMAGILDINSFNFFNKPKVKETVEEEKEELYPERESFKDRIMNQFANFKG